MHNMHIQPVEKIHHIDCKRAYAFFSGVTFFRAGRLKEYLPAELKGWTQTF